MPMSGSRHPAFVLHQLLSFHISCVILSSRFSFQLWPFAVINFFKRGEGRRRTLCTASYQKESCRGFCGLSKRPQLQFQRSLHFRTSSLSLWIAYQLKKWNEEMSLVTVSLPCQRETAKYHPLSRTWPRIAAPLSEPAVNGKKMIWSYSRKQWSRYRSL